MSAADPHHAVHPGHRRLDALGDHAVGHLVLLEVGHRALLQVSVPVDLLADHELEHGVPQELQPLVRAAPVLVGVAVVGERRTEQREPLGRHVPVAERRTCQHPADLHLVARLHSIAR